MKLSFLNASGQSEFVTTLGEVFEHSPWVAERAWTKRPFSDVNSLHVAMTAVVREAADAEKLALIRAHPELAGREAVQGTLTADSSGEQGRLGFTSLTREEFMQIADINRRYREKFGFPCIVALRLHATRASVIAEMQRGLEQDRDAEIGRALAQIGEITRGRLEKLVEND
jgi:chitin deacetylase